jgi:hypothetical protein
MAKPVEVSGENRSGVPVLTVRYGAEAMLQYSGSSLSAAITDEYEKLASEAQNPSVVVKVEADTAGSPLIRALVSLYRRVATRRGMLVCAGYPADFVPALSALGVLSLPGFRMVTGDVDAAVLAAVK